MSKSSVLDQQVKQYILDCINLSDYDIEAPVTPQQAAKIVYDLFAEHCFYENNKKRFNGNEVAMIADYMQGLPSFFDVDYTWYEVDLLAVKWGSMPENFTEKQAQKIHDNWFQFIANKLIQIKNGYHVKGLTL